MRRRALGAVLALVALAGLPLRTLAACTMPAATTEAPDLAAGTDAAGARAHAHHASDGVEQSPADQSPMPGTPVHEGCPDLAACAVAAIPAAPIITPEVPAMSMTPRGEPLALAPSFGRSVEPPPPRA